MAKDIKTAYRLVEESHYLMQKAAGLAAQDKGLTLEQLNVLTLLMKATEPQTPSMLAKKSLREPHTMTGLLNRMEVTGLVERVRGTVKLHPNWVIVKVTSKGRQAYMRLPDIDTLEALALDSLAEKDLALLVKLLGIVKASALKQVRGLTKLPILEKE